MVQLRSKFLLLLLALLLSGFASTAAADELDMEKFRARLRSAGAMPIMVDPSTDPRWTPGGGLNMVVDDDGVVVVMMVRGANPPSADLQTRLLHAVELQKMVKKHGVVPVRKALEETPRSRSSKEFLTDLEKRSSRIAASLPKNDPLIPEGLNIDYYSLSPTASSSLVKEFEAKVAKYGARVVWVDKKDSRLPRPGEPHTYVEKDEPITVLLPKGVTLRQYMLIDQLSQVIKFHDMINRYDKSTVAEIIKAGATAAHLSMDLLRQWEIAAKDKVLKDMKKTDPNRKIMEKNISNLKQARDPLHRFRMASGRINWGKFRKFAATEASTLGRYMMALFLKELAVALKRRDRFVIEEFFDNLLSMDFFANYSVWAAGVIGTEYLYTKYLQKFIKPKFINTVLKSSLAVTVGLMLPDLVLRGKFDGRTFMVNASGLFLSNVAMKGVMSGIKWAVPLGKVATKAPWLAKVYSTYKAARWAKAAGWVYCAAEVAVVLYFGDKISQAVEDYLEERDAKKKVGEGTEKLIDAVNSNDPDKIKKALDDFQERYGGYRNFLYKPLKEEEALLMSRLNKMGRGLKATEESYNRYMKLYKSNPKKYAALKRVADNVKAKGLRAMEDDVRDAFAIYERHRDKRMKEIYQGNRRNAPLVNRDATTIDALTGDGGGLLDRAGRAWNRRSVVGSFYKPSSNRLETYDDETSVLHLALAMTKNPKAKADIRRRIDELKFVKDTDGILYQTTLKPGFSPTRNSSSTAPNPGANGNGFLRELKRGTGNR